MLRKKHEKLRQHTYQIRSREIEIGLWPYQFTRAYRGGHWINPSFRYGGRTYFAWTPFHRNPTSCSLEQAKTCAMGQSSDGFYDFWH